MNAKTAKALRGMARAQTQGQPERTYGQDNRGSIRLHRDSTRGRYRILKRAAA